MSEGEKCSTSVTAEAVTGVQEKAIASEEPKVIMWYNGHFHT